MGRDYRPEMTDERFVEKWNSSVSLGHAASQCGQAKPIVAARAIELMADGWELKTLTDDVSRNGKSWATARMPTQEEIKEECRIIQMGWSEQEEWSRSGMLGAKINSEWEVPEASPIKSPRKLRRTEMQEE